MAAILLSVARLMLPVIENYKSDIELWVSDFAGQQVEIATLDAAWYGLEPQLILKGVQLLSKDRTESFGYFQQARIGLNIVESLYERRLKPGAFTIEGARLVIVRQADGSIRISGLEKGAKKSRGSNNQAISDWLFNQRLLDVKDSEIHWLDLKNEDANWVFSEVNLRFRNDDEHHLISGSVALPEELGARLEVAMDVRGDLLSANGWSGSAYVEGANLRLSRWLKKIPMSKASVSNALLGFRLWSQWRKAELASLKGEVFSNGFQLSVDGQPKIQVIESLSSNILVQKMNNVWEATFDEIVISTAKTVWPTARVDMAFDLFRNTIEASVSYINIPDVLPVIRLFNDKNTSISTALSKLKPRGVINDLYVSVGKFYDEKQAPVFYTHGKFSQFNNVSWKKIPGVQNLTAEFAFNNHHFFIDIPRQDFGFNYGEVFQYPANLENVTAQVFGKDDSGDLLLSAKVTNAEYRGASTNGSLYLNVPKDSQLSPALDLAFYFKHGSVKNAKYYIPSKLMHRGAVDWITRALLAGKVNDGGLLYFGKIKEYPFFNNEGLFDLTLNIEKGKLRFADDWPLITQIKGEFNLHANGLSFYADSARSLKNKLLDVDVVLPEFRVDDMRLKINGYIVGESEHKINYLHGSPLENIFAKNILPLKIEGKSRLNMDLDIPLNDVTKTKVEGVVSLIGNHVMAKEWMLDVKNLYADLSFDNHGIYTNKFKGNMNNVLLDGKIDTQHVEGKYHNIIISAEADVNERQIAGLLENFIDQANWANYISGVTTLKAALSVPVFLYEEDKSKKITLSLDADLEKIALLLPYPLSKEAGTADRFQLSAELSGEKRFLNVQTNKLDGIFEITEAGDVSIITRGGIGFEKKAELPSENGYRFLGHLDWFSWTQWEPIIFPEDGDTPLLKSDGASGSQYFNVELDKFEIFGIWFGKTAVQASSGAQLWSIHLSGDDIAGEIFIPVVLSSSPLVMNMDKLVIELPAGEGHAKTEEKNNLDSKAVNKVEHVHLDPRNFPEVKARATVFVLNRRNFGTLNAVATRVENGLHLSQFSMKTEYTDISATGDWLELNGKQVSKFDILIKTSHLGKTITSWGFEDAFGGGVGDIRINANWAGNPSDFSFQIAEGNMDVDIKDTSLLDFELGAAKMAGLFLPRRLLLDFRDVFSKGMHFDSIKGQYQIEGGNAFTSNLRLDGPAADIIMAGRIGLVAEDYDQLVTVNRRLVGDSISTLAALAANPLVNPLLAAQVYALKKLFEKQIDDMLTVQYTIKGAWEDPKITPVVKNLEDRGEQLEDLFE